MPGNTCIRARFCGEYTQGAGALSQLLEAIRRRGGAAMVVASGSARVALSALEESFHSLSRVEKFNGECCEQEIARLAQQARDTRARVIVGAGGGKTLDTAKLVGEELSLPVICVPTVASNDGAVSGCAVIYDEKGVQKKVCLLRRSPDAVIVDTAIICSAPPRLLAAGMGDALATYFEAESCKKTRSINQCGGAGGQLALAAAQRCYDVVMADGVSALKDCVNGNLSPEVERVVEANILLSGIGFECGGVGCAHAVCSGLGMLEHTTGMYHGEKVAYGVLAGLHLNNIAEEVKQQVYRLCIAVGLPVTLAQLGLEDASKSELKRVAMRAAMPGESLRNEPGEPGRSVLLEAIEAADAYGQKLQESL